jgi:hypothetical protein
MVTERQRNPWLILLVLCFGFFCEAHAHARIVHPEEANCKGLNARVSRVERPCRLTRPEAQTQNS